MTTAFECRCQCHLPIGFRLAEGQQLPPVMRPCSECVAAHRAHGSYRGLTSAEVDQ